MVWKCPKCKRTSTSYDVIRKHYYDAHHKSKNKSIPKGMQKKVFTFKPAKFLNK